MKILCAHTLICKQTHKQSRSKGSEYFTATSFTSENTSENLFQINIQLCSDGEMKIERFLGMHLFWLPFIIYIYCLVARDLRPFQVQL